MRGKAMMSETEMRNKAMCAKKWNILVFCIFAVIFAMLVIAACIFTYQRTYSRHKWDTDKENRYKIVSSMLEKHQLVGMTEAEVVQLLGSEDADGQTSFKISKQYFPPESTLVYYLGVDFIDCNWLVISLDNGIVADYCVDVT